MIFTNKWISLNLEVACNQSGFTISNKRYMQSCIRTFKREEIGCELTFPKLGYHQLGEVKLRTLRKYYLNEQSIKKARDFMESRKKVKMSSMGISFISSQKPSDKPMGHCIRDGVVTTCPNGTTLDVFYRVTEVTKKFGADLLFFDKVVLPELPEVERVNIYFSNLFFAPAFVPILTGVMGDDIVPWFEELRHRNPTYFREVMRVQKIFVKKAKKVSPFKQIMRIQRFYWRNRNKTYEDYCRRNIKELFGE